MTAQTLGYAQAHLQPSTPNPSPKKQGLSLTGHGLFASHEARLCLMAGPAAVVTLGLFVLMGSLITKDFAPIAAEPVREIKLIVPEKEKEAQIHIRDPYLDINVVAPPPMRPQYSVEKNDVDILNPVFDQAPQLDLSLGPIQSLSAVSIGLIDDDATPLRAPVVSYPSRALARNLEGECQVIFDVDVQGRPFNVKANCTDRVFSDAARRAVSRVYFSPKIVLGKARVRQNVVYPISFSLTK